MNYENLEDQIACDNSQHYLSKKHQEHLSDLVPQEMTLGNCLELHN